MPEVLILCEYPALNGAERSLLSWLPGMAAGGFMPIVAAPANGPLADALCALGVEHLPFEVALPDGRRCPLHDARARLAELIARRRPAIVHANSLSMARLSGPVVAELKRPSIGHLRDIVGLSAQAAADINSHRRLLAVSAAVRDWHVGQGLAAGRMEVLHNGVDLDTFCPRPPTGCLHRELSLPPTTPLIGSIGQLGLRKGQDVLLEAAAGLPSIHVALIGERTSQKDEAVQFECGLHELAQQHLPGRVHFLGVRDDVPRLLPEWSLLVHAARQEPLGRVLLEAAACGLPILATAVGGTSEIFPPGSDAAVLVPPGDPGALATAIAGLVSDPARRTALGQAARRRAVEAFDVRRSVAGLLAHYQSLL